MSHSEVGDQPEELEDDYTPLDPTYLPPGLEEEGGAEKPESSETSKGANESIDEVSGISSTVTVSSVQVLLLPV